MTRSEAPEELPLSKTKKKQLAKEVEKLAQQLAELPAQQLDKLELDAELAAEVAEARDTVGRGSHKRQLKHLAGLLRRDEELVERLCAAVGEIDQVKRGEVRQFHQLEEIRDRLCNAQTFQEAFDKMIILWPQIDRNGIARLARSVHNSGDKKAFREIFRRLRDAAEAQEGE